jgi:DNA-binding transcriptional LysR family regulator
MELYQVRYFVTLCGTLNFARAAELCNVTQPALTRAVQRLEEELGGPLLQRERNLTQLTELGRLMRPLLEQTLAAAEAVKENAGKFRKNEVASLRVGLPPSVSARVVSGSLAELTRRLPAIDISLRTAGQEQLVEALLAGELDTALVVERDDLPERLDRWPLFIEGYRVAFGPDHRFAALDEVASDALADEIVIDRPGCEAVAKLTPARLRHRGETAEQIQHLAAVSRGVALVPDNLPVMPPFESRRLADPSVRRTIALAAVSGRRHSVALDSFIKLNRARDLGGELGIRPERGP